jgi:hypothetical protein
MLLDHYVSQVHLKNFNSVLGNRLYAIRKSDLKPFTPRAEDICRTEEGNTNPYLAEARAIEEFLKPIEPKYNASLTKVRENAIDIETIYTIAGFVAYIVTWSPAAMRIGAGPLKSNLESSAALLDAQGLFEKAPASLGGKSLTELLQDGTVNFKVDQKYPQALGISAIAHHVSVFGNSTWQILRNTEPDNPFFTSGHLEK